MRANRISRNAPCPCGSGRKFKRCCDGLERLIDRIGELVGAVFALPALFPLLRPECEELEEWLAGAATADPSPELIDEGAALLPKAERARIVRAHADRFPEAWHLLVATIGDEALPEETLVAGAVCAALEELREPDPQLLELLEERDDLRADPADTLGFVLEARDLWSAYEAERADEALAAVSDDELDDDRFYEVLGYELERFWSDDHERRLALLVGRLRPQLPLDDYPMTSAALATACADFDRDASLRARVALFLLADALGFVQPAGLDLAA